MACLSVLNRPSAFQPLGPFPGPVLFHFLDEPLGAVQLFLDGGDVLLALHRGPVFGGGVVLHFIVEAELFGAQHVHAEVGVAGENGAWALGAQEEALARDAHHLGQAMTLGG